MKNEFSSTIWYQIDDTNTSAKNKNSLRLCSYVTKRKSRKQNQVVLLTTTYPLKGITMDDNVRKPAMLKLYDFTKGGTDIIDQRMARRKYSKKAKTNKWAMVGFYYLHVTARINTHTVWSLNNDLNPRKTNTYEFGMKVAKSLFLPMIMERPLVGLNSKILSLYHAVSDARLLASSGKHPSPIRFIWQWCQ